MSWSLEQAMEALKIPESERSKYKEEFITPKDYINNIHLALYDNVGGFLTWDANIPR